MVSLLEANNYFQNERLFSEKWFDLDMSKQKQALNMATNQINSILSSEFENEEDYKKAVFEQALYLIETQNSTRSKMIEQGVTSFSVEGLSESYDTSKSNKKICNEAMQYIKKYTSGGYAIC